MFQAAARGQASRLAYMKQGKAVEFIPKRLPFFCQESQHPERVENCGNAGDGTHGSMVTAAVTAVMTEVEGLISIRSRGIDHCLGRFVTVVNVGKPFRILPEQGPGVLGVQRESAHQQGNQ